MEVNVKTQQRSACVTFLPPGEQVSGGGVLVMFSGLEPQLEGEEPRILIKRQGRLQLDTFEFFLIIYHNCINRQHSTNVQSIELLFNT